ncbi:MAG: DUF6485 family protein [Defluviitaleaceae bacterium]|nr:DUF6485 family protein [Defluviitaleaceae bacterium]
MSKHFCTCNVLDCPNHPQNNNSGCDNCIQKNLQLGEIPACFWVNETIGTTEYSAANFAKNQLAKIADKTA